jgi:hypothetical protein
VRKFTVFTVILTIVVIVVMAEVAVNEYLPNNTTKNKEEVSTTGFPLPAGLDSSNAMTANVLGADMNFDYSNDGSEIFPSGFEEVVDSYGLIEEELSVKSTDIPPVTGDPIIVGSNTPLVETIKSIGQPTISDFEDPEYSVSSINVNLREEHVRSAGFSNAYLEDQDHLGYLYKTIYIDDFYDVEIEKIAVRTDDAYLAKVYVFKVGLNSEVEETFQLIKLRSSAGIGIEVNESNEYGNSSFYMNDQNRPDTAFLTVRIGKFVYAFSYPKEYHAQIKNLIQLLVWELG